jgi:hypothetical protein
LEYYIIIIIIIVVVVVVVVVLAETPLKFQRLILMVKNRLHTKDMNYFFPFQLNRLIAPLFPGLYRILR